MIDFSVRFFQAIVQIARDYSVLFGILAVIVFCVLSHIVRVALRFYIEHEIQLGTEAIKRRFEKLTASVERSAEALEVATHSKRRSFNIYYSMYQLKQLIKKGDKLCAEKSVENTGPYTDFFRHVRKVLGDIQSKILTPDCELIYGRPVSYVVELIANIDGLQSVGIQNKLIVLKEAYQILSFIQQSERKS